MTGNCPSCGGPVEFRIGSSAVVVCSYCNSVVARSDRGFESHGKVAALIDTGSPLRVGATGRYRGDGFRITGRSQMRHQAGGVWDEWYAAFDDGRWGWVAEAQGRFYVTFRAKDAAPQLAQLRAGAKVPEIDMLTVAEIGEAALISAEGELPWTPEPGSSYVYADLTGSGSRFATIDYSEEPPLVFRGYELPLAELGISGGELRAKRVSLERLACTKCGGPLDLKAPDQAERIWCPNCGAGHDIEGGNLQYFKTLKKGRVKPVIPLGATGTIDGDAYVVAGFMQRAVRFDIDYFWTEYLLYNKEKSYRWLVHSDDHWSFVTPLRPGEVVDSADGSVAKNVFYEGASYKLFQDATARVTFVLGEFYWKVEVGESVDTVDYIKPPFGISKEMTTTGAREVSYSHARYMDRKEVQEAFGIEGLPRPSTIGSMQPFTGARLGKPWLAMLALLLVTAMLLAIILPGRIVVDKTYDLSALPAVEGAPENGRVLFTDAFDLSGKHNLEIRGNSLVQNSWIYVAGDFVNEATGALESFELPIEYYSGVDGGESWSEGSRTRKVVVPHPAPGRYALRLEAQWENGKIPPPLHVKVREGVFRWPHFILALIALSIWPALALLRQVNFEMGRWKESSHSPFGAITSDDEDEE